MWCRSERTKQNNTINDKVFNNPHKGNPLQEGSKHTYTDETGQRNTEQNATYMGNVNEDND